MSAMIRTFPTLTLSYLQGYSGSLQSNFLLPRWTSFPLPWRCGRRESLTSPWGIYQSRKLALRKRPIASFLSGVFGPSVKLIQSFTILSAWVTQATTLCTMRSQARPRFQIRIMLLAAVLVSHDCHTTNLDRRSFLCRQYPGACLVSAWVPILLKLCCCR